MFPVHNQTNFKSAEKIRKKIRESEDQAEWRFLLQSYTTLGPCCCAAAGDNGDLLYAATVLILNQVQ